MLGATSPLTATATFPPESGEEPAVKLVVPPSPVNAAELRIVPAGACVKNSQTIVCPNAGGVGIVRTEPATEYDALGAINPLRATETVPPGSGEDVAVKLVVPPSPVNAAEPS